MAPRFDAIVVGLGAHGSAALYNLAKWGSRVLGLERWAPGHTNGSHHGSTRITRQCYAEGAEYVPLLKHSFDAYATLERESKQKLYFQTGVLNMGEPLVSSARAAAEAHGLPHQLLDASEVARRFPGVSLPAGTPALFEENGGILRPEAMVAAHCSVAEYHGATIRTGERVLGWTALPGGGVEVATDGGSYRGDKLIISAGAWVPQLVPELQGLAIPQRVTVGWFAPRRPELYAPSRLPVWLLQSPGAPPLYGFPEFGGERGFKIGAFTAPRGFETAGAGGDDEPHDGDADRISRAWRGHDDEAPLRAAVEEYFPHAAGPLLRGSACVFTNTPDGHFIVDLHPRHPEVVICSACTGHGFKLSPAVGLAAAELARHGRCVTHSDEMRLHRLDAARPGHAEALARFSAAAA